MAGKSAIGVSSAPYKPPAGRFGGSFSRSRTRTSAKSQISLGLSQSLCQKIFDHEMMNRLRQVQERAAKKDSERPSIRLTSEEENALRYAAGSVPFRLLKKYETRVSEDAVYKFVRCLQSMGVQDEEADGDHSYTFSDYTSVWLQRNDRGHLFKISDETYRLFYSFELIIRRVLPQQLKSSTSIKEKLYHLSQMIQKSRNSGRH